MIDWVDKRLQAWGDWAREEMSGLGYPKRNTIDRLMREGSHAAAPTGFTPEATEVTPEIEEIESLITRMPDHFQLLVMQIYYYGSTPSAAATRLKTSYDDIEMMLERIHEWVAERVRTHASGEV